MTDQSLLRNAQLDLTRHERLLAQDSTSRQTFELSAVPMILDNGAGSELRRPLGISLACGLIVSRILTLYTTPVVYLYLEPLRLWALRLRRRRAT
jgi:Cu/Ag efflux pump CusA